jgi:hypothetical protein
MLPVLIIIPIATFVIAFLLYRHVGKREFMRLDIVQFLYAFVIIPIAFVWMKAFILYFARNEIGAPINDTQLFVLDSAFSVIFLYLSSFVAIHSLTKTFEIQAQRDPLYDIIEHAEKFHLWISHTSMYFLVMLLFVMLGLMNIYFPLAVNMSKNAFLAFLFLGYLAGILGYASISLSNFTEKAFMRLMKLGFGFGFSALVTMYFVFDPKFSASYVMYWFVLMSFSSLVASSFFIERSDRLKGYINRFHHKHKDGWTQGNFLLLEDLVKKRK